MSKEAMKLALEALEAMQSYAAAERKGLRICDEAITALREALAKPDFWEGYVPEPDKRQQALDKMAENARELGLDYEPAQQEPVAWLHTKIEGVAVPHRPADLDKHPDRWTALYPEPKPCPTCEALARTVMMDQTAHDKQRKPLTDEQIMEMYNEPRSDAEMIAFARAIEAAHGITGEQK